MLSQHETSDLGISGIDLDLLGNIDASMTMAAGITTAINMRGNLSMPLTASGQMVYSRPIGGELIMSMVMDGAPLLYRPLGGEIVMPMTMDGEMVYSRPIGGELVMSLNTTGQMVYFRPIGGSIAMSMTGSGSLTTAILMTTAPGMFFTLDMSLFSGFVEGTGVELDPIPRATSEYPELWTREPSQYIGIIDANDQLIEAELSGRTYYLNISWNEEMQDWSMGLRNLDKEVLVSGIMMVPLYPLLRQMRRDDFPPGELIIAISGANRQDLHRQSFINGEAVLFYVEPEDLADGAL